MFDHRSLATDGLFPGLVSTFSVAIAGALLLDVIIEPIIRPSGGGGYVPGARKDKYKVTIRVSRNGKIWKYERVVTNTAARVLAKVLQVKLPEEPQITVHSVSTSAVTTDVKAYKK